MQSVKATPTKARALNDGYEAWFYENARSIEVYIYKPNVGTVRARITLSQIQAWLKRAEQQSRRSS